MLVLLVAMPGATPRFRPRSESPRRVPQVRPRDGGAAASVGGAADGGGVHRGDQRRGRDRVVSLGTDRAEVKLQLSEAV